MQEINNHSRVLIAGVGNLGFRYLQGALDCKDAGVIFLYEKNPQRVAELQELPEVTMNRERVRILDSLEHLPEHIDIAIVSTSSESRLNVVHSIEKRTKVRYWILEKVLCQSLNDLEAFQSFAHRQQKVWVNTFFRTVDMLKVLKSRLASGHDLNIEVSGGNWGLACNTIHFLDFSAWLANDNIRSVDTSLLDRRWMHAKRQGFWEILGELKVQFVGGNTLNIRCDDSKEPLLIEVNDGTDHWSIYWDKGIVKSRSGVTLTGGIPYQSQMTPKLVTSLIKTSESELTPLSVSILQHRLLIDSLLAHWNSHHQVKQDFLPIT